MTEKLFYIHPTAEVSPDAHIGAGTRIWSQVQVREHAHIGEACNIGAYVRVGSRVKIQNYALVYRIRRPTNFQARGARGWEATGRSDRHEETGDVSTLWNGVCQTA